MFRFISILSDSYHKKNYDFKTHFKQTNYTYLDHTYFYNLKEPAAMDATWEGPVFNSWLCQYIKRSLIH